MATKSRRPATQPAAYRFSPTTRLVAGLLAFMMVGSLIFVVVAVRQSPHVVPPIRRRLHGRVRHDRG